MRTTSGQRSAVELRKQLINQSDTEFNAFPPYPWLRTLACALLLDSTARTSVRWIKAHDRRAGNCLADRVAAQAMESDPPPPPLSLEEATMHALSDLALRKVAWSHPMAPRALFAWRDRDTLDANGELTNWYGGYCNARLSFDLHLKDGGRRSACEQEGSRLGR